MRQREAVRSLSASAAVSGSAAVSPAPGCLEEQKSSTGTADQHHRAGQCGVASRMDQSPAGQVVGRGGAVHHADVVEQAPEPQPAACTVPLQPPVSMPSRERGGSVSSWPRAAGAASAPPLKHTPAQRLPEGEGEVQGGSNGREFSVEQRRTGCHEEEGEVQGGGAAAAPADGREGNGVEGVVCGGRADAIIGDGIVGGVTDDLENKMSVEMGMEVEGGDEAMMGEVVQGCAGEVREEAQEQGGGRADAVIMRAEAGDEEEEVPSKPMEGGGAVAGDGVREHAQGAGGGGPPQAMEGGGEEGEVAARAAAAVSATVGAAAAGRDGVGWPRAAPGSPRLSESGSGNGGVQAAWDNESEAFQGSAGVVEGVERNDSAAGEAGAPEVRHEGVGEISVEAGGPRHEGAGEIGGAASRATSHVRADSMFEGSGFHVNSPIFGAPQESAEGNAASHAAAGGPGLGKVAGGAGAGWSQDQGRGGGGVAVDAPHVEGQGEIAGPTSGQRGRTEPAAAEALAAHLSRAGRSREGEGGLSEGAGEVGGGVRVGTAWDAAGAGAARVTRGEETAVESALNAVAVALSGPSGGLWVTPIGSRNGGDEAAVAASVPMGERSSEGGHQSGRVAWNLAASPAMQHQASRNLGEARAAIGGTGKAVDVAMAAPQPVLPHTLSRAASAEDIAAGSGSGGGRPGVSPPLATGTPPPGQPGLSIINDDMRPELRSQRSVYGDLTDVPPPPWLAKVAGLATARDASLAARLVATQQPPLVLSTPAPHLPGPCLDQAHLSILQVCPCGRLCRPSPVRYRRGWSGCSECQRWRVRCKPMWQAWHAVGPF